MSLATYRTLGRSRLGGYDEVEVAACKGCGALVVDQEAHDRFHEAAGKVAETAFAAGNELHYQAVLRGER